MRRTTTIFIALGLIVLVAAGTGYSFRSTSPQRSTRDAAQQAHTGGTLKLLAKAAGGTIDPHVNYTLQYWQLYQATYDGLLAFKKAGGNAAFKVVPDLATNMPTPTNGGKTWVFKLRKGIKFSNGKTVTPERRRRLVPAHLQGEEPDLGHVLRRHRRRDACLKTPATCTLKGGVIGNDAGQHGDDQPRRARPGVQVQARRPARDHPPGGHPAEGRRHEADPRHGRVLLHVVQPEQAARA